MSISWSAKSNAFERSVNNAQKTFPLSTHFFHFSKIVKRGSRTIAPEENCPKLKTNPNTNPNPKQGPICLGAIVRIPLKGIVEYYNLSEIRIGILIKKMSKIFEQA